MTRTKGAKDKKPRDLSATLSNLEKARKVNPIVIEHDKKGYTDPKELDMNTRMIRFMGEVVAISKPGPDEVDLMEERFAFYLSKCDEYGLKVGNMGAYAAIGITYSDVYRYENSERTSPRLKEFLKKVKQICAMYREGMMVEGKLNPVVGIFHQKNYDGLKDQQETVVKHESNFKEIEDKSSLEKKYLDAAYTETDMSLPGPSETSVIDVESDD